MNKTRKDTKHFIAMAGLHGYLPQYCEAYPDYDDAVNGLADLHELGTNRKAKLKRDGCLEMNIQYLTYCYVIMRGG